VGNPSVGDAPLADEPHEPVIASSDIAFDGAVWDVRRERFAFGDGQLVREFVAHTGAVAVLVIDDDDRMLAIRQYRHPIRERNWELPAGLLDVPGEDPLEAGKRELAEEVDLVAAHWEPLIQLHTTPGGSNEIIHVYRATGLSATAEEFARHGEEADIVARWVAVDEAVDAVLAGRARNGIFIAAVLAEHARRTRAARA
jgi:8-oxo-dGDP phosphatase